MSELFLEMDRPVPTGGTIISFKDGVDAKTRTEKLRNLTGSDTVSISSLDDGNVDPSSVNASYLEHVNIGFLSENLSDQDRTRMTGALAADGMIEEVRPEFQLFALQAYQDTPDRTWGVAAVEIDTSPHDGSGVKVAI